MKYEEMMRRRKQRGPQHVEGLCGYMASLCPECGRDEREYLLQLTEDKPAKVGENLEAYWRRFKLPFLDMWYEIAQKRVREADIGSKQLGQTEKIPSLREMITSKTYPGAPAGIQITVFPTGSFSHPDKFSLFSSTQNAYFGKLKDTFQEAVEGANKENIRMYGTPMEAIIEEAKRRERVVGTQDLYWLSVDELKAMCRRKNLPDSGNKNDLVQRLKK